MANSILNFSELPDNLKDIQNHPNDSFQEEAPDSFVEENQPENLLQRAIQSSRMGQNSGLWGATNLAGTLPKTGAETMDIGRVGLSQLPNPFNPTVSPMSLGASLVDKKSPIVGIPQIQQAIAPQTQYGKDLNNAATIAQLIGISASNVGEPGVAKSLPEKMQEVGGGIKSLFESPYDKTMKIREAIPQWISENSEKYGNDLENKIQSSPTLGLTPSAEAAEPFRQVAENPELMGSLKPNIRQAIQNHYEELATSPKDIEASDLINRTKELRKLVSGNKFDVNSHAISEITEGTGRVLEKAVPGLSEQNAAYKPYFDLKKFANQNFQPWKSEYDTSKAEKLLSDIQGQSTGTRKGLNALEEAIKDKTGGFVGSSNARQTAGKIANIAGVGTEGYGIYELLKKIFGH